MQGSDYQGFADRLIALAAVFDRPPPGVSSLKMWFHVVKEFPFPQVDGLLDGWAKHHGKMPVPAEVWKVLNDGSIDKRAIHAAADKIRHEKIDWSGPSARGTAAMREIMTILKRPKLTPREHWQRVFDDPKSPQIAFALASKFLKHHVERDE